MRVTADCVDPLYAFPVIYSETDVATPVPHHRVSGFFLGTFVRFNLYFPPRAQWDGRFFQLVYPLSDENASDHTISFGAASGAYTVQTNESSGYRANAAAAKFSKTVAARYYQSGRRVYGYVYGGSGGSYQTIGSIESTTGVWDGAVPVVNGAPTSLPTNFTVRALARFVLEDKAAQIADAVAPGGSGDPYAGLDEVERAVLREVTRMGIPLRAWPNYRYVLGLDGPQGAGFGSMVGGTDPTYPDDFWSEPGYLGTEESPLGQLFRAAKVDHFATITRVERNLFGAPARLVLDSLPPDGGASGLEYTAYRADGTTRRGTLTGSLDPESNAFTVQGGGLDVLYAIEEGDKLRIDNRSFLAGLVYHRYQVPDDPSYYPWDQFRDSDGQPIYPQREVEHPGPAIAAGVTGGSTHTGRFDGRMIMVQNLIDSDAFPWQADWYSHRVRQALGERYGERFRLWYNDNTDHLGHRARLWSQPVSDMLGRVDGATSRLVDYAGIVDQALRDVSAWAERGVAPAESTRYDIADSQVTVPADAAARRGIQPVVDLTVDDADQIDVAAGEAVTFEGSVTVPPGAGEIVAAEWDFAGTGDFTSRPIGAPKRTAEVRETFTYTTPGTYFPVLRATAQRDGDPDTPFTRVQNLDRVRVVVR